ncbi:hypothetical protein VE02_09327 [Pseudogymnoascus sp. 03VT05]|nr:hypothetical protein VE02_09327 [Pseudogymnoascus sp. 03VT05]
MDPDFIIEDPAHTVFFENSRKIYEYLQIKMINVAGVATSLEETKEVFFRSMPEEEDSPEQLLVRNTQLVENSKRDLGDAHPDTIFAISELAEANQLFEDRYQEAVALGRVDYEYRKANLKEDDPDLYESRSSHVRILLNAGNREEARSYGQEVLGLVIKSLGENDLNTDIARLNLSVIDAAEGKLEEALEYQKELHGTMGSREGVGFHNRDVLMAKFNIAHTDCSLGR